MSDMIGQPPHYIAGRKYEPIAVVEDWQLPYHLGNVVKYVSRAGRKPGADVVDDLKKARWFLCRYIDLLEGVLDGRELVLATLAVNPAHLPLVGARAAYLAEQLNTLACECREKHEHAVALDYRIMEPPK